MGCKRLPVGGAWHSEAMADAVDELHAALAAIPRTGRGVPFVCNRDGSVAARAAVRAARSAAPVRPIRWTACATTLAALGVTRFIAVGPGRLLRAMVARNPATSMSACSPACATSRRWWRHEASA
jgi:[acyl-carrier-protein] S-malonyltransferase